MRKCRIIFLLLLISLLVAADVERPLPKAKEGVLFSLKRDNYNYALCLAAECYLKDPDLAEWGEVLKSELQEARKKQPGVRMQEKRRGGRDVGLRCDKILLKNGKEFLGKAEEDEGGVIRFVCGFDPLITERAFSKGHVADLKENIRISSKAAVMQSVETLSGVFFDACSRNRCDEALEILGILRYYSEEKRIPVGEHLVTPPKGQASLVVLKGGDLDYEALAEKFVSFMEAHPERYANKCLHCNGAGTMICDACLGTKKARIKCEYCEKKKPMVCPRCKGNYKVRAFTCNVCGGTGKVFLQPVMRKGRCLACGGSGKKACSFCDKGKIPCRRCGGTGFRTTPCTKCKDGILECPDCLGKGYKEAEPDESDEATVE